MSVQGSIACGKRSAYYLISNKKKNLNFLSSISIILVNSPIKSVSNGKLRARACLWLALSGRICHLEHLLSWHSLSIIWTIMILYYNILMEYYWHRNSQPMSFSNSNRQEQLFSSRTFYMKPPTVYIIKQNLVFLFLVSSSSSHIHSIISIPFFISMVSLPYWW